MLLSLAISPLFAAEIALIIDDMGNTKRDEAAFLLPKEVAFSILPLTHLSEEYSHKAAVQKRDVMLHIPMESLAGKPLGPGALIANMSAESIRLTLIQALATVPDAIGVNNHMGSKLTQLSLPMNVTMEFLAQQHLFFVDSRTTRYSKALKIAQQNGVLSARRNVFLDNDNHPAEIDVQFKRLIQLSQKDGYAVGIAHPYPQTIAYLQKNLPTLVKLDVQLVAISDLLHTQQLAVNHHLDIKPDRVLSELE
ncbi:divergent polysaccharide deacetylase family protein [Aliiglaciecola sp. 3_MG-2023]|uniref:divergent polysaccharide deacetylase family protein n=1 Tax=Aliiglaciecola sp. 3_MG-2023 TaxID=3062644 RepID=UPI0026E1A09F|nr:divergent polysaccharide deacetylase family protein [Aliiglaciecola sp. 3_MG-2023]MDO6692025.1 divergent polysaccharide deacetylase family protein [Aliiglaciecola sp. 3_MG-2023]